MKRLGAGGGGGFQLVGEVTGGGEGKDALVALGQEGPFEQAAALVVQEILVPAIFNESGNNDNDSAVGIFFGEIEHVLNQRDDDETIG